VGGWGAVVTLRWGEEVEGLSPLPLSEKQQEPPPQRKVYVGNVE
jgi:hypothetical protein